MGRVCGVLPNHEACVCGVSPTHEVWGGGGVRAMRPVLCVCVGVLLSHGAWGGGVASKSWGMCMVGGQRGMSSLLPLLPEF